MQNENDVSVRAMTRRPAGGPQASDLVLVLPKLKPPSESQGQMLQSLHTGGYDVRQKGVFMVAEFGRNSCAPEASPTATSLVRSPSSGPCVTMD